MIKNKYNLIVIFIYFLWIGFLIHTIITFDTIQNAGQQGTLFVGLPILTIVLTFICVLFITITNLLCKKNFYYDLIYIIVPFLGLVLYAFI